MRYLLCLSILTAAAATPLAAQTATKLQPPSKAVTEAAGTITAADVARRVGIIADDSMMGRDTPSPGLEQTAAYIAAQFKAFGLEPAGDEGGYLQRYPLIRRRLKVEDSYMQAAEVDGMGLVILPYATSAIHHVGALTGEPITGSMVFLGGPPDPEKFPADSVLKGKFLMWVMDWATVDQAADGIMMKAMSAGMAGVIGISNRDTAVVRREAERAARVQVSRPSTEGQAYVIPPGVEVPEAAIVEQVPEAQQTFDELRAATVTTVFPFPEWEATVMAADTVLGPTSAPNVVAILEGSDPVLKHEYLVYSAHMDHIGISPGQPDSINNGADDDASGTVGVIELAEAFSRPGARPKRSVIFLAVSGEEKGLWGSDYYTANPPVSLHQMVANINLDMIGRNWPDTIVAIGPEHSDLGQTLAQVNTAHPELGMTVIDDPWPEENFFRRSDHFNFARNGVPILFFFNGNHPDYHGVGDSPDKINAEKESRIVKLLFYVGQAVANADERPKWNPESYAKIVEPAEE
ncbi:MAG: M28 family peptidase [Gemmatimonadales bacterium]|nr:M28 family peptidase [Gemmatimonadales bacterium]